MQRYNLPVSYPMTARKFPERHGLLDSTSYEQQLLLHGDPTARGVEYPINKLTYADNGSGYNLLLITLTSLSRKDIDKAMPNLNRFAQESTQFTQHYSSEINRNGHSSGYITASQVPIMTVSSTDAFRPH